MTHTSLVYRTPHLRSFIDRLEVLFWSAIIRLISQSRLIQRCLLGAYQLQKATPGWLLMASLLVFAVGFLIGVLMGLILG